MFRLVLLFAGLALVYVLVGRDPPVEQPLLTEEPGLLDAAPSMPAASTGETKTTPTPAQPVAAPVAEEPETPEGSFDPGLPDSPYHQAKMLADKLQNYVAKVPVSPRKAKVVAATQQKMLLAAERNQAALRGLMDAYRSRIGTVTGVHLRGVLAELKDPEVEQLGRELAAESDRTRKIAGFDLLADLGIPSEETLNLVLGSLVEERDDKDVMLAALNAMTVVPLPKIDNDAVLGLLTELTQHPNSGVRSASLFKLGEWAKDGDGLAPVIQALYSGEQDDRVSAAMALQRSAVVSGDLREELVARMVDPTELWEIRRLASEALARFELDDEQFALYETFREGLE